jgi:uncharacterized membrane protein
VGDGERDWNRRAAGIVARASFASIAAWIALTMIARGAGLTAVADVLDLPFHILCHRNPERVLSIADVPMPLCSRCAGLWIGMSLSAAIAWPVLSMRTLRIVMALAAALMLVEVVTQDLGLHPVFHPTRVLTGLFVSVPFGGAIGGLIARDLKLRRAQA